MRRRGQQPKRLPRAQPRHLRRHADAAHPQAALGQLFPGGRDDELLSAELLILDELGYVPLDIEGARLLFQVMSVPEGRQSMIVTTNIEFSKWGTVFGDDKMAAAVRGQARLHGRARGVQRRQLHDGERAHAGEGREVMRTVDGTFVPERCPVDELPEYVLSHWDVGFLCGLHECPGCGLTPDHPLIAGTAEPEGACGAEWRPAEGGGSPADA